MCPNVDIGGLCPTVGHYTEQQAQSAKQKLSKSRYLFHAAPLMLAQRDGPSISSRRISWRLREKMKCVGLGYSCGEERKTARLLARWADAHVDSSNVTPLQFSRLQTKLNLVD